MRICDRPNSQSCWTPQITDRGVPPDSARTDTEVHSTGQRSPQRRCPSGLPRVWPTRARHVPKLGPMSTPHDSRHPRIARLCARRAHGCCPQCTTDRLRGGRRPHLLAAAGNLRPRPFLAGVLRSTRDRFPGSARFAVDIPMFRVDQQWNVTLPPPARRIPPAVPPPRQGDDDSVRRCGRRGDSHSRRQRARSLGRPTPLTELESSKHRVAAWAPRAATLVCLNRRKNQPPHHDQASKWWPIDR